MALAAPTLIVGANNFTAGLSTLATGTATISAAIGDLVIICTGGNRTSTTSITDSVGNTYTAFNNTASGLNSQAAVHYSVITAAIVSGSTTFTGTWSAVSPDRFIYAYKVTGASATPQDVSAASNTALNAWSSGATTTLAQAAELAIGVCANNTSAAGITSTPGGGYTELTDVSTSDGVSFTVTYLITAATTAQTASGTWASGTPGAMRSIVATFKEASGVTNVPYLGTLQSMMGVG